MADPIRADEYAHLVSPAALAVTLTRGSAQPWVPSKYHWLLSDELVRLYRREPGQPSILLVMMPPQHGKSTETSQWFPAWALALEPSTRIILCSYGLNLAAKFGRATRQIIETNYPMLGTSVLEDSRAAHRWGTRDGGGMECRGVGGGISGFGFDIGIVDDPVKDAQDAQSQIIRDNLWDWWQQAFLTRRSPTAIIVVVMTRWHEDDLIGRILQTSPEKCRVLRLPALAEEGDPLGRLPGEGLWPERYPLDFYEDVRRKSPRVFNALYQQRPTAPEGSGIRRDWWRYYTERQDPSSFDRIIQVWDPTFKDVDSSDFVAGGVIGIRREDSYLLDATHARLDTPKTIRAIQEMRRRWPTAKRILIEETASGPAIIQLLQHTVPGILPVRTGNRSKETRLNWGVNSVSGYIEAGHFYLPREIRPDEEEAIDPPDPGLCEIAQKLVNEAAAFPYGEHDDLVDMLVHGVQHLMPASWSAARREQKALAQNEPVDLVALHRKQLQDAITKRMDALYEDRRRAQRDPSLGLAGWSTY